MLPTFGTLMYPELLYGPLILSAVISAPMAAICVYLPVKPGLIGYLCLFSGVAGVIAAAISLHSMGQFLFATVFYPFYGIYIVFMFIPMQISFHHIAKQQRLEENNKTSIQMGTGLVYLGYIWSVVFYAATIAFTVIQSDFKNDLDVTDYEKKYLMYVKASNFLFHSHWGFIAINFILTVIFYKHVDLKSSRLVLICFNIFTIIPIITMTVYSYINHPPLDQPNVIKALGIAYIFLVDLPNSMAILAWFIFNGHKANVQKADTLNQKEEESRQSSENIPIPRFEEALASRKPPMDYRPWTPSFAV
jgi:hypothetical protein